MCSRFEVGVKYIHSLCTVSFLNTSSYFRHVFCERTLFIHLAPEVGECHKDRHAQEVCIIPEGNGIKCCSLSPSSLPHSTQSALYSSTLLLAKTSGTHQTPLRVPILRLKLLNQNFTVNGALLIVNTLIMSAASVNGLLGVSKSFLL